MVTTRVPRQATSDASKSASPATSRRPATPAKENSALSQLAIPNETVASPLQELRSLWQFAAIVQFFELFRAAYQVEDIGTDRLEQAFLDEYNPFLRDMAIQLLKPLTTSRVLTNENWSQLIRNEFTKRNPEALPMTWRSNDAEDSVAESDNLSKLTNEEESALSSWNFFELSLFEKVITMHYLCEWQFDDSEKFRERLKNDDDAADWRVLPIGYDSKYKTYWLFDDNRLYCQHPLPRPKKASVKAAAQKKKKLATNGAAISETDDTEPVWELVCSSKEDWLAFPGQFKGTKNRVEKELVKFVNDELLPRIIPEFEAKEKEREMELAILNRKRSSRIIMKEIERAQHQEEQAQRRLIEEKRQAEKQRIRKENKERKERWEAREQRALEKEQKLAVEQKEEQKQIQQEVYGELRVSARHRETRKRKREADQVDFDCMCGQHGHEYNDEQPTVTCQRCGVLQHLHCVEEDYPADAPTPDWSQYYCSHCQKILEEREREEERIRERKRRREEKKLQMRYNYLHHYRDEHPLSSSQQDTDGDIDIEDTSDMDNNISVYGSGSSAVTTPSTTNIDANGLSQETTLTSHIKRIHLRVPEPPTQMVPLSLLPSNSDVNTTLIPPSISPQSFNNYSNITPIQQQPQPQPQQQQQHITLTANPMVLPTTIEPVAVSQSSVSQPAYFPHTTTSATIVSTASTTTNITVTTATTTITLPVLVVPVTSSTTVTTTELEPHIIHDNDDGNNGNDTSSSSLPPSSST